jgi:hypothetical protein
MVKLIKLNAPFTATSALVDTKAQFTAFFNEDIILKPNSRIALRNIQFSTPNVDSIEPGQGMRISLKDNINGSKNWKTVLVNEFDYRDDELGVNMYEKINSAFLTTDCPLIRTGVLNRVMFNVGYTDRNIMHIDFKFIEDYYNTNLSTNTNIQYDNETFEYSKTGNYGNWDYINTGKLPLCLGTGTLNCNIDGLDDVNGCAIGIIQGIYTPGPTDPKQPADTSFFFKAYTESNTYWYKQINEIAVDTGIDVQDQDLMTIQIQLGSFKLIIVRADGEIIETNGLMGIYFSAETDDGTFTTVQLQYYGYFGLKNENSKINDISWTQNPFFSANENGIVKTPLPTPHVVVSSLSDAVPSTVSIDFLQGFNHIIGFNNVYYEHTGVSGSFVGNLSTTDVKLPDGFYVVLDNIRLNSYDFNPQQIGRRKNILTNITSFEFLTTYSLITYETDSPTFIDMDNKEPIILNSISVSVYDNDNNLLLLGSPDKELVSTLSRCPLKLTLLID